MKSSIIIGNHSFFFLLNLVADVDVGMKHDSIASNIKGLTIEGDEIDEIIPMKPLPNLKIGELGRSRKQTKHHKVLRRTNPKAKSNKPF